MPNYSTDKIIIIDSFNVRSKELSQAKIAEYAEIFASLPPVSVFIVGGKPYLVDGWHRMKAAALLEMKTIKAVVVGRGTLVQAQDNADSSNLQHGIMLTADQRKSVALRFIARHPEWSQRKVADVMGCSAMSVSRWTSEAVTNVTNAQPNPASASAHKRATGVDIKVVGMTFKEWFNRATDQAPMDTWNQDRLQMIVDELCPIVECHRRASELLSAPSAP